MDGRARIRRGVGTALCLGPALLMAVSFGYGLWNPQAARTGVMIVAWVSAGIALLNFWLSHVRGWLHVARGRDPGSYRHASGLPLIGAILALCACVASFGSVPTAALGLVALALDTGGPPWFLAATWNDESLWADR